MTMNHALRLLAVAAALFAAALPSPAQPAAEEPGARSLRPILAGDRLRITVDESPDLNGVYAVAGDGTIDIKYIGRVVVEAKTTDEAGEFLANMLTSTHFKKATVLVEVADFVTGSIMVLGAVASPGLIPYKGDDIITLMEALAQVGGMTKRAAQDQVKIFRWKTGGAIERDIITVNVKQMMTDLDFTRDQYLRPRDIVMVPELGEDAGEAEFLALGEFGSPGFHPHVPKMDMIRAVVVAGGVSREAQMEMARVLRPDGSGNYTMIPVDLSRLFGSADMKMNMQVYPGDILFLPSIKLVSGGKVYFLGEVDQPGMYPLNVSGDSTLARTILQRGGLSKFADGSKVKILRKAPDGKQQTLLFDVEKILETGQFESDIPLQDEDVIIIPARIFNIF